jgi:Flp pilus assembly protein TadD
MLGKYIDAEQMYRQALELKGEVLGREHPNNLGVINYLAIVLSSQGRYLEAEQIH